MGGFFMEKRFHAWETAALLALCLTLLLGTWAEGRQRAISGSVLRLHVIAASDAPEEQALKLRVRDAVLDYLAPKLEDLRDRDDARALLAEDLDGVRAAAESAAEGRAVSVTLGRERYPLRQYEGFRLPAGEYESLRVVLGEGEGRNWWCIVFPPLCLEAVEGERLQSVMGPGDWGIVCEEEGYVLRFRLVELWGELMQLLEDRAILRGN
jgi:stage II sporulation protein R